MEKSKTRLFTKLISTSSLKNSQIDKMYSLFQNYYENVEKEIFLKDLIKKDKVFLLFDKADRQIRGFSTIVSKSYVFQGKTVRVLFSGDTVIDARFWGTSALKIAFAKNMVLEKLRKPFSPLYWFLISKGYKTYLLMSHNFHEFYPHHAKQTPHEYKEMMDYLSQEILGESYSYEEGLLIPKETKDCLKDFVAPIHEKHLQNPHIKFFAEANPDWKKGVELVCMAKVEVKVALSLFYRKSKRWLRHSFFNNPKSI